MKLFQRRKEDFICGHCGSQMQGSGYTNHCSNCLWSRHVDVHPGDRNASCRGLMEPVGITQEHGEYILLHHCVKCKFERKNKVSTEDNYDLILELSRSI
jgi:hypothetical protein